MQPDGFTEGGIFSIKLFVSFNVSHEFRNAGLVSPVLYTGQILIVSVGLAFEIVIFHAT
jgi:hypothetical protein